MMSVALTMLELSTLNTQTGLTDRDVAHRQNDRHTKTLSLSFIITTRRNNNNNNHENDDDQM